LEKRWVSRKKGIRDRVCKKEDSQKCAQKKESPNFSGKDRRGEGKGRREIPAKKGRGQTLNRELAVLDVSYQKRGGEINSFCIGRESLAGKDRPIYC